MAAAVTATARGTSSFAVALTQKTAPVHEFRCLYTHDLRKKKKIWHDGSLRFHTFNRRVMIYDDTKNYLGDLHYREAEELQEGEELRLDKGVLVEVGDRIGTTETDLAPLLDRRKPDEQTTTAQDDQPPRPSLASRTLPAYASGRPKSLAAVLGPSQGRIGRAKIAVDSPYEQGQNAANSGSHEPPWKRQRLISGKENKLQDKDPRTVIHEQLEVQRPTKRSKAPTKTPVRERTEPIAPKNVVEISSEDEDIVSPFLSSRPMPTISTARKKRTRKPAKPAPQSSPAPAQPKQGPNKPIGEKARADLGALAKKPALSAASGSSRLRLASRSMTSSLRFAKKIPRRKLMYTELLSSSVASNDRRKGSVEQVDQQHGDGDQVDTGEKSTSTRPSDATTNDLFSLDDMPDFRSSLNQIERARSPPSKMGQPHLDLGVQHSSQRSSPLFVSQSPLRAREEETVDFSQGDFVAGSPAKKVRAEADAASRPDLDTGEELLQPSDLADTNLPAASNLAMLDQQLFQSLANVQHQPIISPERPRTPFRRVVSESDSPVLARTKPAPPAEAMPPPHQPDRIPSALARLQAGDNRRVTRAGQPFKPPTNLSRSASDTTGLALARKQVPRAVNIQPLPLEVMDTDVGPWSSREAYLLFDFWPKDREDRRPHVEDHESRSLRPGVLWDEDGI